jgi:hypothetical protein
MSSPTTTNSTKQVIDRAKSLARDLRAKFYEHTQGLRHPIALNTEKFARCVSEEFGIKIEARLSSELGNHLRGLLLRESKTESIILIADSNNECWRRFVFVKEICHLFLDDEEDYCVEAEDLAIALLSDEDSDSPQYASELAAAYAAIEGKTPYQIAFQLKTPRKYVEFRMREWGITIRPESDPEKKG